MSTDDIELGAYYTYTMPKEALATKAFIPGADLVVSLKGRMLLSSVVGVTQTADVRYVSVTVKFIRDLTGALNATDN